MELPVIKKLTSVDPLSGALAFLAAPGSNRSTATTTELPLGIITDTCLCNDTHRWETGIYRPTIEGRWVIVSQHESEEAARIEHEKWVELLTSNPSYPIRDIDNWSLDDAK